MGAVGYGPLEADCCCDSVYPALQLVEKNIYKMLKRPGQYSEEEIRGACHFVYVMQKHWFYSWDDEEKLESACITLLQQLLDNRGYIAGWEPARIKAALRKQIKQLKTVFDIQTSISKKLRSAK